MKFVAFAVIVMIASVSAAPKPHKIGFGAVAIAEPVVPVPVVVPRPVPIVQPVIQPIVPVFQSYYPVVPVVGVGRFG